MTILYYNYSLNSIGKIYDQINSVRNITIDSTPFINGLVQYKSFTSVNDLIKIINTLGSLEDADTTQPASLS